MSNVQVLSIVAVSFIGTRTGFYAMTVLSDAVITSVEVAAERKNVLGVLFFCTCAYLTHISDNKYPVVTFKSG